MRVQICVARDERVGHSIKNGMQTYDEPKPKRDTILREYPSSASTLHTYGVVSADDNRVSERVTLLYNQNISSPVIGEDWKRSPEDDGILRLVSELLGRLDVHQPIWGVRCGLQSCSVCGRPKLELKSQLAALLPQQISPIPLLPPLPLPHLWEQILILRCGYRLSSYTKRSVRKSLYMGIYADRPSAPSTRSGLVRAPLIFASSVLSISSPDPAYGFNKRLRRAYESMFPCPRLPAVTMTNWRPSENAKITDPVALRKQLELAEHIKRGESARMNLIPSAS